MRSECSVRPPGRDVPERGENFVASPDFLSKLTDSEIGVLAAFHMVHTSCNWIIHRLVIGGGYLLSCPSCSEYRQMSYQKGGDK